MELTPLYLKGLLSSLSQFGPSKIQFGATNTNLTFLVVTLKTNLKETKAILIMVLCSNQIYPKILPFHHAISTQIIKYFTFFPVSIWTSYISRAQQPHVASGYHTEQSKLMRVML